MWEIVALGHEGEINLCGRELNCTRCSKMKWQESLQGSCIWIIRWFIRIFYHGKLKDEPLHCSYGVIQFSDINVALVKEESDTERYGRSLI